MAAVETVLSALQGVKKTGAGWTALCPGHDDSNPSLSISEAGGKVLLKCHAGCDQQAVIEALKGLGAWPNGNGHQPGTLPNDYKGEPILARYEYADSAGNPLFYVCRTPGKEFPVHTVDGRWGLKGIKRVLYRLPELAGADYVFLPEGEKDADTLTSMGLTATTAPGGAGAPWLDSYTATLARKHVTVMVDSDAPGRKRGRKIAEALSGKAASVKVLDLAPDREDGFDVSDWAAGKDPIDAGEELSVLVDRLRDWAPETEKSGPSKLVCLVDVVPTETEFLSYPYLPIGKLTLLDGDPGIGKTFITQAIATGVTLGRGVPGMADRAPANVLFLNGEDGLADTIKPRFEAMGADFRRLFCLTELLSFEADGLDKLDEYLTTVKPVLTVIDPLSVYLGANVDAFRDNHVRPLLSRMAELAERHRCAFLVLRHLTKATKGKAIYRGQGSIGFMAAARSGLLAGADSEEPGKGAIFHVKHNLTPEGPALGYKIDEGRFFWTGESSLRAEDVLGDGEDHSQLDEAKEFLADLLRNGPMPSREVVKKANRAGISERTLWRAKKELHAKSAKQTFLGEWCWSIEVCQTSGSSETWQSSL